MGCGRQVLRAVPLGVRSTVVTICMGVAQIGLAQPPAAAQQTLPPPPALPAQPDIYPSPQVYPPPQTYPVPGERVYSPPSGSYSQPTVGQYRVYVDSSDPYLLQQIKTFEPGAFFQTLGGRRVIQTGTYNSEANARQQVALLASQGIRASITTQSGGQIPGGGESPSGYYAIVPGSQNELPRLRDRAIQLGVSQTAIRLRDRPIGPHIAVGPYATRSDAEIVKQFLRDRQFDARVFYGR